MKLFQYEGGIVRVDPELRVIKEFRDLIAEDKDREKRTALKWFAYIYHMLDFKSPYQTYSDKERKSRVLEAVDLPASFKMTARMKAAYNKYQQLQATPATRSLKTTREALLAAERGIAAMNRKIDELLVPTDDDIEDGIEAAVKLIEKLLVVSEKLPNVVKVVADLEEKVKQEQSADTRLRGGGSLGAFEE